VSHEVRRATLRAGGTGVLVQSLRPTSASAASVPADVERILVEVRRRGDDALVEQARAFGSPEFTHDRIRVTPVSLGNALGRIPGELRRAIELAADQVRAVAEAQRPTDRTVTLDHGQRVTIRAVPVDSAGCYVPGGRAAYPSSLIMATVPAQVAGVDRIAIASPAGTDSKVSEVVRATAAILGVEEVYAVGGAGAVGALAYGTATVSPVSVIAGPGNAWVTEAKRQVHGVVGIDSLAGPSEVLILADASADPGLATLDLLAQAEHGPDSVAVLASTDPELTDSVAQRLRDRSSTVPGAITLIDCMSLPLMIELAEALAPEHLQLVLKTGDLETSAPQITRSGCVFIGRNGATAFGDYMAGSNHILPTSGAARFASSVGPATFMRRMSVVEIPQTAVDALGAHLNVLAEAEGFPLHGESVTARMTPGELR
jgi:histidinol dehydrogenase